MNPIKVTLNPSMFASERHEIVISGELSATGFRYRTGVCGLQISNSRGEIIVLPFQGQQIWRARFCQTDLTMKSMFDMPVQTQDYLSTYGGFMLHCGATAMGVPSGEDRHPLHGELPNMPYDGAVLEIGEDSEGSYISLSGSQKYNIAFTTCYLARPEIRLYAGATTFHVKMTLTNLRQAPFCYMYLCHINFRPVDGSHLIYSAPADPDHVFAHQTHTDGMQLPAAKRLHEYIDLINKKPAVHHIVDPASQIYDPEIVMTIRYLADPDGFAHSLQQLPSGDSFYVAHRIKELPLGLRWIARTHDEDAMGLVLPATAEHLGQVHARKAGMLKVLDGLSSTTMSMVIGYLDPARTAEIRKAIDKVIGGTCDKNDEVPAWQS